MFGTVGGWVPLARKPVATSPSVRGAAFGRGFELSASHPPPEKARGGIRASQYERHLASELAPKGPGLAEDRTTPSSHNKYSCEVKKLASILNCAHFRRIKRATIFRPNQRLSPPQTSVAAMQLSQARPSPSALSIVAQSHHGFVSSFVRRVVLLALILP